MKYDVLYVDPPWPEGGKRASGLRMPTGSNHQGEKFATMDKRGILGMPISQVAADSCVLFLWSTWRHVPLATQCIEAWGFRWVTLGFNWIKMQKDGVTPKFGTGSYTRGASEACWVAARGKGTLPPVRNVRQVVQSRASLKLAEKPDFVRSEIERLYPDATRLEIFGRKRVPGWTVIGDEVTGRDVYADLQILAEQQREGV